MLRRKWSLLLVLAIIIALFVYCAQLGYGPSQLPIIRPLPVQESYTTNVSFQRDIWCQKWAVVAPTNSEWAAEAICRQVRMHNWCLVIVFGQEPSKNYNPRWFPGDGNGAIVYLSPGNYEALRDSKLVKAIPWNNIGRKIIGYFYAITHGATVIWDFDDDNMLKFWIPGAAPPGAPSIDASLVRTESVEVLEPQGHMWPTYNPYPALGAPSLPSWPRGLPLDDALREECSKAKLQPSQLVSKSIAVFQSLSDHQPDADSMYQGIMPFPFYFKKPKEMKPLIVPPFVLTPYNKRSTLHFEPGFWALCMPITVDREFSDIWRSYIGQRLFWEAGLRVGFLPRPLVVQDQNIHIPGNMSTIKQTSTKLKQLITFLGTWRGTRETLVGRIEELWTALSEHKFLTHKDVEVVQLWLQGLLSAGYKFPDLRDTTISNPVYPTSAMKDIKFPQIPRGVKPERYTVRKNMPEYNDEVCYLNSNDSLTFWTSDIHFGSRLDQPTVLAGLGQEVILALGKTQDRHPDVWKMRGIHRYNRTSKVIKTKFSATQDMNRRLTEEMIRDNFEFYKGDSKIASVDAFVCLFQPGMCEMWMPFNKTIVFIPAHRYNMGRCTIEETNRLNKHLSTLASMEHPKHVISASSRYDLEYLRHYTGLDVLPLYSFTGYYTANYTYSPTRSEIPVFARTFGYNNWDERFITDIKKFKIIKYGSLSPYYTFSDLVQYRALVYLPYAVMSYKMSEFYSMAIPLFFPSMKYLRTIKPLGPDRSILAKPWCSATRLPLKDSEMVPHPGSIHPYSPNAFDEESEYYWLQLADFFQWPHITYFDDFEDLERKLATADLSKIHKLMVEEVKRKKKELLYNWCKVFRKIKRGQRVPQDYSKALKELYGVSRLQVY